MSIFLKTAAFVLATQSALAITPGDYQKELQCFQGLRLLHLQISQGGGTENLYDATSGLLAMPTIERSDKFFVVTGNGAAEVKLTRAVPDNLTIDNVKTYGVRIGLAGKPKVIVGYNVDKRFSDTRNDSIVWQHGNVSDAIKPYIVDMPLLDTSNDQVKAAILARYKVYLSHVFQRYQHDRRTDFIRDAEAYRQIFGSNPNPAWATDPAEAYMQALNICGQVPGLEQSARDELAKFENRDPSPVAIRKIRSQRVRSIANVPDGGNYPRQQGLNQPQTGAVH